MAGTPGIARDYLDDVCTNQLEDRGSRIDWLRFFWDLDTDEALSFTQIADTWDDANPRTWNANGVLGQAHADDPWERFKSSASSQSPSVLTEVQNQENNGVDH